MSTSLTKYTVCCHNLHHDDDIYQPDDSIELDIKTAQPLLDCKPPAISLPGKAANNNVTNISSAPDQLNPNRKQKPEDKVEAAFMIEQAIKGMEVNDANFTEGGKGKPDAKVLTNLLGWTVTAKERDAVWSTMKPSD